MLLLLLCATEDVATARRTLPAQAFTWRDYTSATFAEAKRTGKPILLHGAAVWCHWCHVMEASTYRDPAVGKLINTSFIPVRVDMDARPDLMERYAAYGFPATIIFSPDGKQIGNFRGYLDAKVFIAKLTPFAKRAVAAPIERKPVRALTLAEAFALGTKQLDGFYDEQQGGWGMRQKLPLGENIAFELARGNTARALHALSAERALIDREAGGVFQYSTGGVWTAPHYEKLMTIQAEALAARAHFLRVQEDAAVREDAALIARYMRSSLASAAGEFLVSQDADVDDEGRFMLGADYYSLDLAARRALGRAPHVDANVYPYQNGIAIHAFVLWSRVSHDPSDLAFARAAADRLLATSYDRDAQVMRRRGHSAAYLVDSAAFALALVALSEATKEKAYGEVAKALAAFTPFLAVNGGLYDASVGDAVIERGQPFAANVMAARLLLALSEKERARKVLAFLSTELAIENEGRMLGAYLSVLRAAL